MCLLLQAPVSLLQSCIWALSASARTVSTTAEEEETQCGTEKVCAQLIMLKTSCECMHSCARITAAKPTTTDKIKLIFFQPPRDIPHVI